MGCTLTPNAALLPWPQAMLREMDKMGTPEQVRDQALCMFARLQGLNKNTAMFADMFAPARPTKLRKMCATDLSEGKHVAIAFIHEVVKDLVNAKQGDLPTFEVVRTGCFHTAKVVAPTLQGPERKDGEVMMAHETAAPGCSLFPESLGMDGLDARKAPRGKGGCQQPGCNGKHGTAKVRSSCGHWACAGCRTKCCSVCRSSLAHAMRFRGSWTRDQELHKCLDIADIG